MKVSIALCTYNGEKFLMEQLESFLRQTRLPDEIVVCDDRSTDASIKLIEKFSQQSSFPVRIHVNEINLGSIKNFERAISLCTGDIIFLSDQDDVWLPEKIQVIESEFEQNNKLGMVFTNAELVDENLSPLEHTLWDFFFPRDNQLRAQDGKLFEVLLDYNVVTGATIAFRSCYRDQFLPIPTDIPYVIHDAWIALVITANAEVRMLSEPLIKYRQHSNQQLGIKIKPKIYAKREDEFKELEAYQQNEHIRLSKMSNLIETLPQFKSKQYLLKEDFIKSLQQERSELLDKVDKVEHYTARKDLPVKKLPRILPIIRELKTGRYARYSNGYYSVVKDLFKHWDPSPEGKIMKKTKSIAKFFIK
jgi:glycosyltransferase involved in cell wall biosynthesis